MALFKRRRQGGDESHVQTSSDAADQKITLKACFHGLVASIGGFLFGYTSGQISGFFLMDDYLRRFGELQPDGSYTFSAVRQGTIVGMLSIGCLIGALIAGHLSDKIGRRMTISSTAFGTCIGTVIEVSSTKHWAQFAVGRLVTGFGIGSLSVAVPMFQSESSPAIIRGLLISCYQLFVTLGIWTAEMIDFGTEAKASSASWRIPDGLTVAWAILLGGGILLLPESPRYAFRKGREEEARHTIAVLGGLEPHGPSVNRQIDDMQEKLQHERALHNSSWHEFFTGPGMFYRTALGITLQAGQQLTGVNYFFYFGTTVFASTGLNNSYVTQLILGTVNSVTTIAGLVIVQKCSRRNSLIIGATSMMLCFLVYAFVGHFALDHENPLSTPSAGSVLVVFSCLAIAAFATTWGTLIWSVVAELYPSQHRSRCMAVATSANWLCNFLIAFFTRFITDSIDYLYGLIFAAFCASMAIVVFFFLIESKGRTLEEIDTMYMQNVNPIMSGQWVSTGKSNENVQSVAIEEETSS